MNLKVHVVMHSAQKVNIWMKERKKERENGRERDMNKWQEDMFPWTYTFTHRNL